MSIKRTPDPLGIGPDKVTITKEGKKFSVEDENIIKKCLKFMSSGQAIDSLNEMYAKAAPIINRDNKRQIGVKKEKRPRITAWIKKKIKLNPDANTKDLWNEAPEWLTDEIGPERFKKRVTDVRKGRK
jgi:hypothetical protein